jgi:hypothetical protein
MSEDFPQFIFVRDGDRWLPQPLATGPWYAGSLHGSAMLGLLARAIEGMPGGEDFQVTRFTVDMMRAAPMEPLETPTTVQHAGRTSQFVEARIEAGGKLFARATALRLRMNDIDTSSEPSHYGTGATMPPPDENVHGSFFPEPDEPMPPAFHQAFDFQLARGVERPAIWFRMRLPFVEGETLSPFVRTALVSDWTYSVPFIAKTFKSGGIPAERAFSAINPDTSLNLHRPARGDWVGLDGLIHYGDIGSGSALAFVHDVDGPVGHSSQSILLRGADKMANSLAAQRARALREGGQS